MTVLPFRGAGVDAASPLAPARLSLRGVPAAGPRLRLVRPHPLEGVADVTLVLLHRLPGPLVTPCAERTRHG